MLPLVEKPKSERNLIADRIAEFVRTNDVCSPFGGDVSLYRGSKRPCYLLAFSKPRVLDGTVSVFAPNFIQVRFNTGYRALPAGDSRVYGSEKDALDFIRLAFVEHKFDEALEVPTLKKD